MAIIHKPLLPPLAGYTEQVDADGNHFYAPTEQTLQEQADANAVDVLGDAIIDTDIMNAAQNDRLTIIEDALIELANLIGGN